MIQSAALKHDFDNSTGVVKPQMSNIFAYFIVQNFTSACFDGFKKYISHVYIDE